MKKKMSRGTGKVSRHHASMPSTKKDQHAHGSHGTMNQAHGTPGGFSAPAEYGEAGAAPEDCSEDSCNNDADG